MKKIILSLFVAGALSMNAQDGMGYNAGDIALTTGLNYGTHTDAAAAKHTEFAFSPSIMYMNKANWGLRGGIMYNSHSTEVAGVSTSTSYFGLNAGVRHFFNPTAQLSFYLDGGISASFPDAQKTYELAFAPGVNYFIHKNWAMNAGINLAKLTITSPKTGDGTTDFTINPMTSLGGLNFGLSYVFKK